MGEVGTRHSPSAGAKSFSGCWMGREKSHEVIRDATLTFAHILQKGLESRLGKEVEVVFDPPSEAKLKEAGPKKALVSLLWVDTGKANIQTAHEPIVREEDEQGNLVEWQLGNPTYVSPRYLVTPWTGNMLDDQVLTGMILQLLGDHCHFEPEDIQGDAIYGEERPPIAFEEKFKVEDQRKVWEAFGRPYRASLCYSVALRLDSTKRKLVRRVKERIIDFKKFEG